VSYKFKFICVLILNLVFCVAIAQTKNYSFNSNKTKISFPFKVFNSILLVDVKVNHSKTLKFIFDSGCKSTIIIHPKWVDSFDIVKTNKVYFSGLGYQDSVETIRVENGHIQLGELTCDKLPFFILTKDSLIINSYLGTDVDGIFGAEIFEKYYVHINYTKKLIELFTKKPEKKIKSNYTKIPVEIRKSKGYLSSMIMNNNNELFLSELLLDTGANIPVIIKNKIPEDLNITKYVNAEIGEGLTGPLYSNVCRIKRILIDTFRLDSVVTAFNETPITFKDINENTLDGNIGNEILNRFDIYFAYPENAIYLKPTSKLKQPFDFNISNIILLNNRTKNGGFVVKSIAGDSPPMLAGLLKGDEIVKIDSYKSNELNIEDALNLLNKRIGKKITIHYIRNNVKTKITYRLASII
jgi:predicted aspartyl protease